MRGVASFALAFALAACAAPARKLPPNYVSLAAVEPYTIELPSGFELVKGRVAIDFRVDQVRFNGVPYVGIYLGSFSSFPDREEGEGVITGKSPQVFTRTGATAPGEWLWKTRNGHPAELHVWVYGDLNAQQVQVARQIALSLRPTMPGKAKP